MLLVLSIVFLVAGILVARKALADNKKHAEAQKAAALTKAEETKPELVVLETHPAVVETSVATKTTPAPAKKAAKTSTMKATKKSTNKQTNTKVTKNKPKTND